MMLMYEHFLLNIKLFPMNQLNPDLPVQKQLPEDVDCLQKIKSVFWSGACGC